MSIRLSRRRDPDWEMDGPAARREHMRKTLMGLIAFSYSFLAAACALVVWAIQLGLAHVAGVRLLILH